MNETQRLEKVKAALQTAVILTIEADFPDEKTEEQWLRQVRRDFYQFSS